MSLSQVFYKFWKHIVDSVKYNYGLNYILAGILTYLIAESGFDVQWSTFSINHPTIFYAGFISVMLGFLVPVFLPLGLYIYGRFSKKIFLQIVALALGQAAILGFVISSFIKVFTGRIPPEAFVPTTLHTGFQFGFLRGGVFNGWPSSHTTVAFAMALAFIELYPNNRAVKTCALVFATLIGLGVSVNIHWFSDVVAGALIGVAIGKVVGVDFRKMNDGS